MGLKNQSEAFTDSVVAQSSNSTNSANNIAVSDAPLEEIIKERDETKTKLAKSLKKVDLSYELDLSNKTTNNFFDRLRKH